MSRTRVSGAWTAVVVSSLLLLLLVVFLLQNQRSVRVSFLWVEGSVPLAVALLLAAVIGALAVGVFGVARVVQLRRAARRQRNMDRVGRG